MQEHTMQHWVFDFAYGKYEIDLGDSNAPCKYVHEVASTSEILLDYGVDRGGLKLRQQLSDMYHCDIQNIGISHGAQESLYLIYRTIFQKGDHVIAFSPGWQQSFSVPALIGCNTTTITLNDNFQLNLDELEIAIQKDTRAVIINFPCNPTGKSLDASERKRLISLLKTHKTLLISDEEYLVNPDDSFVHDYEYTISVSSLSKLYGVPGLRLGWMCGPSEIIKSAMTYKHLTTISNSVLCEAIASEILANRADYILKYEMLKTAGLLLLRQWANRNSEHISIIEPDGTPFCWVQLHGVDSSFDFCSRLLNETKVLLMPAELFGRKNGFRLTFTRPLEELAEGLRRIECQFRSKISDIKKIATSRS